MQTIKLWHLLVDIDENGEVDLYEDVEEVELDEWEEEDELEQII